MVQVPRSTTTPVDPGRGATSDEWIEIVAAECDEGAARTIALPVPGPDLGEIEAWVAGWREAPTVPPALPAGSPDIVTDLGGLEASYAAGAVLLDEMESLAQGGDLDGALGAGERYADLVFHHAAAIAVVGGTCAIFGPDNVEQARLVVPLLGGWQAGSGFGSIWIARQFTNDVKRLDPDTGEIVATVDVGSAAFKLQAADGRMWVRAEDAFAAIDPTTNEVTR